MVVVDVVGNNSCYPVVDDVTFEVWVMLHQLESSRLDAEVRDVEVVAGTLSSEVQRRILFDLVVAMRTDWDRSPVIGMYLAGTWQALWSVLPKVT
jgi:hypothetical protein